MNIFNDNNGTPFSTNSGQAPSFPQTVNVHNSYGQTQPGFWNGSQVVKY
jgi:hypothetical protein